MAAEVTMSETNNKLLARRFLEEVVNTGDVQRLTMFLAPDYVVRHADVAGIEYARQHIFTFHPLSFGHDKVRILANWAIHVCCSNV
jgi:hypothetical protein